MNIREIQTMVEGIVPVLREYIDKSVARSATEIQTVTDEIREENKALKAELMELRSTPITALATISESDEHEVVEEETDSLEMWDGWFARDSLAIVREAQALELRVVQDTLQHSSNDATREWMAGLSASVAALATREIPPTVVNVAPAHVTVEPAVVHVNTPEFKLPAINVSIPERPASGSRSGRLVRSADGSSTIEMTGPAQPVPQKTARVTRDANGDAVITITEEPNIE